MASSINSRQDAPVWKLVEAVLKNKRVSSIEAAKRFAAAGHTNLTPGVKCSCCGDPIIPYKEHHCPTASEDGLKVPTPI